jgi:NitT/TauT family transport system permease protein
VSQPLLGNVWGEAHALPGRVRGRGWTDLLLVAGLAGLLFELFTLGRQWAGEHRPAVEIDLSPWALPQYTFFSLTRGLLAYVFSLLFTLSYGYWAAKDRRAERVLIPCSTSCRAFPCWGSCPA